MASWTCGRSRIGTAGWAVDGDGEGGHTGTGLVGSCCCWGGDGVSWRPTMVEVEGAVQCCLTDSVVKPKTRAALVGRGLGQRKVK
jgi:hypothetical protein